MIFFASGSYFKEKVENFQHFSSISVLLFLKIFSTLVFHSVVALEKYQSFLFFFEIF